MTVTYDLKGKIDSNNAADLENDILAVLSGYDDDSEIIFNGGELTYISSAYRS